MHAYLSIKHVFILFINTAFLLINLFTCAKSIYHVYAQTFSSGFKISAESGTTRPSRIRLDADRDESDTRYNLYLNSALNRLDSDDSTDIPS